MTNLNKMRRKFQFAAWAIVLSIVACAQSQAATTDLATAPLASTSSAVVRPNILFTLDDSGSMAWDYLPDYAGAQTSGTSANHNHCKVSNTCTNGETPFQTNEYNGMAYNPRLTYLLPMNADGTLKASQGSPWTAVKIDGYGVSSTGTINMTNGYREVRYCDSSGTVCKQNGVDTNNPFLLRATISADNPPIYAYPGSLATSGMTVASTPYDGVLNQTTAAATSIYNGTLDINTPAVTTTLAGVSVSGGTATLTVSAMGYSSSKVVTIDYSAISPALVSGDTVTVSGASCSPGWIGNSTSTPTPIAITVVSGTRFTYPTYSSTASKFTNTTCTFVVTHQTVTVNYSTPTSPPLATGDTVVVSGATCDTGYKSGGTSRPITVVSATGFTYVSNAGTGWATNSCTVTATKAAHTAVTPKISKSGTTVTVTLASAPAPALATGSLVTVGNGAGTCDAGYQATSVAMTRISSTSFSYTASTAVGTATDTTCNITQVLTSPPSSPGIAVSGTTVTVYLTNHGLATGDLIQVSDGTTGTCSSGFVTSAVSVTRSSSSVFTYSVPVGGATASSNCRIDVMAPAATVSYSTATNFNANPYYFVIIPTEYCDSMYLTNCTAATGPVTVASVAYTYPAPVRYCKTDAAAALPPGDAGAQISVSGTINCQAKYSPAMGYLSVRYGLFWRGDIVPTRTTYGNESYSGTVTGTGWASPLVYSGTSVIDRSLRSDCAAAPNCTYAEEMTNFSNWYAYYHMRIQMMKSSAGRAFSTLDNRYRVGFVTINESSSRYLPIAVFNATQKTNWYAKFYAINPGNSTPLREAMADAGRYYAGKKPGIFTDDPVEYSCQENFELITTDGYWNGTDSNVKEIDGTTTMGNFDNVDSGASQRKDGAYDGNVAGATDTLADVAMYYYKTDLRNTTYGNCTGALGSDVCQDNVPMTAKDLAAGLTGTQHMTTFSLGLSDGLLTYQKDYDTALTGDVSKIKTGALNCGFSGAGTCNWPLPVADTQTALDDLWHAAINGRGAYYNARDPASLSFGLSNALASINVRLAAAAASATSSPNITQTDKSIFSSTYRTTKWDGEVVAQYLDPANGAVLPAIVWSAQAQLDTLVNGDPSPDKPKRHIYTFDGANSFSNHIKDFLYTAPSAGDGLTAVEQAYFDGKCTFTKLTQCTAANLSAAEIASGNSGLNLVNYLRGDQTLEAVNASGFSVFRQRDHFLGDTVNAKPSYVKLPRYSFTDAVVPTYSAFKALPAISSRQGVLYVGANDGMLHAFNTDTGAEMWSYVPRIVMPNMYKLAEQSYATLHQYYVDGSPEVMDIYVDSATAASSGLTVGWHTILVGGLGLGGRGYYALDVTDPFNPVALWEICSSSTLCPADASGNVHSDSDLGYTYGNPVITKRSSDGKWVVLLTSGYDNGSIKPDMVTVETSNPGSGLGVLFELDAATGAILNKTSTGSGTATSPSGLAKISPWIDNLSVNYTARYIYGGDLNGDLWRFDLGAFGSAGVPTVTRIATLTGPACVAPCTPVSAAPAQSITTRPELGDPLNSVTNSLSGIGNPGIFVGTGRYLGTSDPANTQIQSIYGIKDDLSKTGAAAYIGNPRSPSAGFGTFVQQYIYQPSTIKRNTSTYSVNWSSNQGWFADFVVTTSGINLPISPSVSPGERVNIDPNLVTGTLVVITNVPDTNGACNIGGTSWIYSFNFLTGQAEADSLGNSLAVGNVIISTASGLKSVTTMASGEKVVPPIKTPGTSATQRTSWRELLQP